MLITCIVLPIGHQVHVGLHASYLGDVTIYSEWIDDPQHKTELAAGLIGKCGIGVG